MVLKCSGPQTSIGLEPPLTSMRSYKPLRSSAESGTNLE